MRGVFYARMLEDASALPGGVEQLLDEVTDPRIRDFVQQGFQFMNWYDVFPSLPCAVAFSRIRRRAFEPHMREVAHAGMRKLIPSMFRVLSRLGGPRLAAAHAPRLLQTYFDFIELRLSQVTDEGGSGVLSGIPLYVAPLIVNQVIGFISGALESVGAKEIDAGYTDVTVNRSSCGFDLVTCRGDFGWRLEQRMMRPRV